MSAERAGTTLNRGLAALDPTAARRVFGSLLGRSGVATVRTLDVEPDDEQGPVPPDAVGRADADPDAPDGLVAFIVAEVAALCGIPAHQVDTDVPFVDLGLDSVDGLTLRERLITAYDIAVPASFVYDDPTIDDLAATLRSPSAPDRTGGSDA